MEPTSVPIALSSGEDSRSSMGESVLLNLSLLSNNLQLLSYTQALDKPSRWETNNAASTLLLKSCAAITVNKAGLKRTEELTGPTPQRDGVEMTENKSNIEGKSRFCGRYRTSDEGVCHDGSRVGNPHL
jgi:hypothetical protein